MGCWTGYLLRDEDGSCRFAGVKWGEKWRDWGLVDDHARAELIASVRRNGVLVDTVEAGHFGGWYCNGVAIDLTARVFRSFPCPAEDRHLESVDLRIRTAPGWGGWDAGLAWGGREELGEVVPEARRLVVPYQVLSWPLAELPVVDQAEWFSAWDPDRFELVLRDDFVSADFDVNDLVSVITTDLRVLDYRLDSITGDGADTLLRWLIHGPLFVDALRGRPPYPLPWEGSTGGGLVIDLDQRMLRYWTNDHVPVRLLAKIRAGWPGWELRRLRYGFAEHLAVTNRRDDERLAPHRDAAPEWDAARRHLHPDPRPLRAPHVRVS